MKETFIEIWKTYWKSSRFIKSSVELGKAIYLTLRLLFCDIIWAWIKQHPVFTLSTIVVLLSFSNIYTYVSWKETEQSISSQVWEAQKNIDTIRVNSYFQGYQDATLKFKSDSIRLVDEIKSKAIPKRTRIIAFEKKDSTNIGD